jgi:GDP-D-glucose phosphorylase
MADSSLEYNADDFLFGLTESESVESHSRFDTALTKGWGEASTAGVLRFQPPPASSWQKLPGQYGFVAIYNPGRMRNRREPVIFKTTKDPVDPKDFNFTKVRPGEVLFVMRYRGEVRATMIANVSPFAPTSSLLVPRLERVKPQILDADGLEVAIHTLLLSGNP